MNTNCTPQELAVDLLNRSVCSVAVAAVLADRRGIFSWGWNSSGPTGYGEHAECHCFRRANKARISEATMYVAAVRARNWKPITARPCPRCQSVIRKCNKVLWRDANGLWRAL